MQFNKGYATRRIRIRGTSWCTVSEALGSLRSYLYTEMFASGKVGFGGDNFNFITLEVDIQKASHLDDIIGRVGSELSRKLREHEKVRNAIGDTFSFLKNFEIGGFKYNAQESGDKSGLINQLAEYFCEAVDRLGDDIDGFILLIDEAEQPPASSGLGEFCKLFTERLTKKRCENVSIGLFGITTVIQKLKKSHESSLRVLETIKLEPLEHDERIEVIRRGICAANENREKSDSEVTITPDAEDWIARFSEGFPHFIQQYAYSAFDTDSNSKITIEDVIYGANKENGALDQLGRVYFEDMYLNQINSDDYRKVLRVIAESPNKYVKRQEILQKVVMTRTKLDNALKSLKSRRTLLAHSGKQGLYCLPSDSFGAWIRAQAEKERSSKQEKEF